MKKREDLLRQKEEDLERKEREFAERMEKQEKELAKKTNEAIDSGASINAHHQIHFPSVGKCPIFLRLLPFSLGLVKLVRVKNAKVQTVGWV